MTFSFPTLSCVWLFQGIARTQSPILKNCALESPAFEVIAAVNLTKVQWKGLTLDRLPPWSKFSPCKVSMLDKDPKNIYIQPPHTMNTVSCLHEKVVPYTAVNTVFVNILYFCSLYSDNKWADWPSKLFFCCKILSASRSCCWKKHQRLAQARQDSCLNDSHFLTRQRIWFIVTEVNIKRKEMSINCRNC